MNKCLEQSSSSVRDCIGQLRASLLLATAVESIVILQLIEEASKLSNRIESLRVAVKSDAETE